MILKRKQFGAGSVLLGGAGAFVGGMIGKTKGALIGAGIGSGLGYLMDQNAKKRNEERLNEISPYITKEYYKIRDISNDLKLKSLLSKIEDNIFFTKEAFELEVIDPLVSYEVIMQKVSQEWDIVFSFGNETFQQRDRNYLFPNDPTWFIYNYKTKKWFINNGFGFNESEFIKIPNLKQGFINLVQDRKNKILEVTDISNNNVTEVSNYLIQLIKQKL